MNKRIFIAFICFWVYQLHSQVVDNFDDGDLQNPTWIGDLSHFIVNDNQELQLMAPDAGVSNIGILNNFADSVVWNMYLNMDFAPSDNNKLVVTLWKNQTTGQAYYLEIGENGSDDAIHFYEINANGAQNTIASATLGAMATQPAKVRLKMSKTAEDIWTLSADYNDDSGLEEEFMLLWPTDDLSGEHYFGFECTYSSSRTDKYYFDDINIGDLLPDTQGPVLTQGQVINNNQILISFDEGLDQTTALNTNMYQLQDGTHPLTASFENNQNNKILLQFDAFVSGIEYELSITDIEDLLGNKSAVQYYQFSVTESPGVGDLVVNEILFDPYPNGSDFVEIYNKSNKTLNLNGLIIENTQKNDLDVISNDIVMKPDTYLAFTSDKDFLLENYEIMNSESIVVMSIPSFNNDAGNVSLKFPINGIAMTIDSFDYLDDYHYPLLDDSEGVSLEKINPNVGSEIVDNWHSASSVIGFATPGYQNSNYLNVSSLSEYFNIEKTTFSPNGDGDQDVLLINYNLDSPSYQATIKIFDAQGRKIRDLINNELLSTQGFVKWDGINDDGVLSKVGIYVIWIEIFTPKGKVDRFKKVIVLADFLN